MDPIFALLGAADILASLLLWFPFSDAVLIYAAVFMLAKGFFFLLSTVSSRSPNPLFLSLCVVDILTGVALGSVGFGFTNVLVISTSMGQFVGILKLLSLVKGLYSLAVSVM